MLQYVLLNQGQPQTKKKYMGGESCDFSLVSSICPRLLVFKYAHVEIIALKLLN